MPLLSRIANVFRGGRVAREIDEELESHVAEAIENGRDPAEARRAFGPALRLREESRDILLMAWLDALRADAVFGWKQLVKGKVTSAAAILSLALALGSCLAAFRLIDALLLRPMPITDPDRLLLFNRYGTTPNGEPNLYDACSYPMFRLMRDAVKGQAELVAVSYAGRTDITFGSDQELEKVHQQYVSGWVFSEFGLTPALGRLLSAADDRTPGAHPVAVLSHDYWTRRFAQDPHVIGRAFRMGKHSFEIVGVVEDGFTGTEPGTMIDVYVPTMMNPVVERGDSSWFRTLVRPAPGATVEPMRQRLQAVARAFERERSKAWTGVSKQWLKQFLQETVQLEPAAAGTSGLQTRYRVGLTSLGVLVALVLLIACTNVANLMAVRAAARAREMALRVSIGAGRLRLVQLMLVESVWVAVLAAALGGALAVWAAPFVVGLINPPSNPARLHLPADWRVLGFGAALTLAVVVLFGLMPALRASGVRPVSALKGGEDPHARHRLMHALVAVQVAFSIVVLFVAGLFVSTYDRLAHQPTGFSAERLLVLQTVAAQPQSPGQWEQVAERLRHVPGVERVTLADHALMDGYSWNGGTWVNGQQASETLTYYRAVAPGFLETMRVPLVAGREFGPQDGSRRAAIVNETFVKLYFGGQSPVGRSFARNVQDAPIEIVGVMRDARYGGLRGAMLPVAFFPYQDPDGKGAPQPRDAAALLVRTAGADPLVLAPVLRQEVTKAHPAFRVSNLRTQQELVEMHTVRERLLAMLALFFAAVALVLAGVGLFGVLDYTVLQRRREIGIRLAIGAPGRAVVRNVAGPVLAMVLVGTAAGLLLGRAGERYIMTLLYGVRPTDLAMLAMPVLTLLGVALLTAVPPIVRALRTDPVQMLRVE